MIDRVGSNKFHLSISKYAMESGKKFFPLLHSLFAIIAYARKCICASLPPALSFPINFIAVFNSGACIACRLRSTRQWRAASNEEYTKKRRETEPQKKNIKKAQKRLNILVSFSCLPLCLCFIHETRSIIKKNLDGASDKLGAAVRYSAAVVDFIYTQNYDSYINPWMHKNA